MLDLIDKETNSVYFGEINSSINLNYKDYILKDFFDKPIHGFLKNFRFHKFHFFMFVTDTHLIGVGIVDLTYLADIFAFTYSVQTKKFIQIERKMPGHMNLDFPVNPDNYLINYKTKKEKLIISKDFEKSILNISIDFPGFCQLESSFFYGMKTNNPLRVCAPNGINCWTFTEKCTSIKPDLLKIKVENETIHPQLNKCSLIYDLSMGYMKRMTNWHWAAFSAVDAELNLSIGANLASFINETYTTENAIWIGDAMFKLDQVIFSFEKNDPEKKWYIFNKEKSINLEFNPVKIRVQKINALALKIYFRQFLGTFSGKINVGGKKEVEFTNAWGLTEIQRAYW
ncbi:MAG: DUF2804 domain-containing protein [Spirochaetes bacterium]|nr:DUF2804 domain-containing protein [Spirochaetota bacterium]MBP8990698.1 DUF2804 domain-containing protein [Spirochaetota bacterium]HOV45741.1 DUF2804 domain-containing protein [Exilispira sp.]HQJ40041.1 DUF2804 domain-containing protein [Exilispira sp.]